MGQNFSYAVQITVVGMSLVFASIILLWCLMALLVRLTADRPEMESTPEATEQPTQPEPIATISSESQSADESEDLRRRAAVVAVAVMLAKQKRTRLAIPKPVPEQSTWQAVHRAHQLDHQKGTHR